MRIFEIILLVVLATRLILAFTPLDRQKQWLGLAAVVTGILQLIVEGYRWQMIILYGLTLVVGLLSLRNRARGKESRSQWEKRILPGTGILLLIIAALPPTLFPIPKIPSPSGEYLIGTQSFHMIDDSRIEPYGDSPGGPREFMIQVWYPAAETGSEASWVESPEIVARALSDWLELPTWFLDHLKYAKGHAGMSVEPAQGNFPVLLFSPGYGGIRQQNTYQVEELASQGYFVVALEYTFAASATVFPDGRVALHDPNTLPQGFTEDEPYEIAANALIEQWTGDLLYTLNVLGYWNDPVRSPPAIGVPVQFAGMLDLDKVGLFGHSTGGGASIEFCVKEPRCDAGIVMDPWVRPVAKDVLAKGPTQPFLFMFSESWSQNQERNTELFEGMLAQMEGEATVFTIMGTAHYDFSDLPALSPLAPQLGLKGPLKGERVQEIILAYTVAFFEQALRGESIEMPKFEEVELGVIGGNGE